MTREAFSPSPSYPIIGTGPYQITHPYKEGTLVIAAVLDGSRVELLESEYVVSPAESLTNGEITLTAQFAADNAGATLYIRRTTEIEQGWLGQSSREKGLEAQMDWLAEAIQDLRTDSGRTMRLDNPIKPATALAGHLLTFDESGTPIPGPSVSAISAKGDGVLNEFEKSFTVIDPAGQKTFALNSDPVNKILCEVFVTKFGQTERLKQSEFSLVGLNIVLTSIIFPPASVSIRYRVPAQTSAASSTELISANSGQTLEEEIGQRPFSFRDRPALAAHIEKYGAIPGQEYREGGRSYLGQSGASVISDLSDMVYGGILVKGSMHTFGGVDDGAVLIASNRSDLTPDPANRGAYYYQNYSSAKSGSGSLFGYAANIKRVGGSRKVVPGQFNGYAMDASGASVWGIATEAWTGDAVTEPIGDAPLIGGEASIISQKHDNTKPLVGSDVVFKNRKDGATEVLHGSIGSNAFNRYSKGINISSQGRPISGAFTGWNIGIYFASDSLDESLDGKAVGIDMSVVPSARMRAAFMPPKDVASMAWLVNGGGGIMDGFQYNGPARQLEVVRNIAGASPEVRLKFDLTSAGPTGTILASAGIVASATAGAGGAPPATVAAYLPLNIAGVTYKIPLYSN